MFGVVIVVTQIFLYKP